MDDELTTIEQKQDDHVPLVMVTETKAIRLRNFLMHPEFRGWLILIGIVSIGYFALHWFHRNVQKIKMESPDNTTIAFASFTFIFLRILHSWPKGQFRKSSSYNGGKASGRSKKVPKKVTIMENEKQVVE